MKQKKQKVVGQIEDNVAINNDEESGTAIEEEEMPES